MRVLTNRTSGLYLDDGEQRFASIDGGISMKDISAKQRRIFEYIRDFIDEHDYPPSIRQIQESCSISSTSVVDYNLRILERMGYIRRDREVSRAIEVTHGGTKRARVVTVPI